MNRVTDRRVPGIAALLAGASIVIAGQPPETPGAPDPGAEREVRPPSQRPPSKQPATPAETGQPADPPDDPLPDLDELLGTTDPAPADRPRQADRAAGDLDRLLSGEELGQAIDRAVKLMDEAAVRLRASADTGLTTQRIQEDAVRLLDQVISSAEQIAQQQQQQQQQRSSSSSSASRQRPRPGETDPRAGQAENRGEVNPPDRADGPLGPAVVSRGADWGALPERVREALRQGTEDAYSALYRSLTEAYYRRLAEEAGR